MADWFNGFSEIHVYRCPLRRFRCLARHERAATHPERGNCGMPSRLLLSLRCWLSSLNRSTAGLRPIPPLAWHFGPISKKSKIP
jgi:hypothetical protein